MALCIFDEFQQFWQLYRRQLRPVCDRWGLNRMELDVLLFLANNPEYDTAACLVERRKLAKSHVSSAVAGLADRGLLERWYRPGDRRTVHLRLCPGAREIVEQGRAAQHAFGEILTRTFTREDRRTLEELNRRMQENVRMALEEK